jgi:hypothetical protein
MAAPAPSLVNDLIYQLGALDDLARVAGIRVDYVRTARRAVPLGARRRGRRGDPTVRRGSGVVIVAPGELDEHTGLVADGPGVVPGR